MTMVRKLGLAMLALGSLAAQVQVVAEPIGVQNLRTVGSEVAEPADVQNLRAVGIGEQVQLSWEDAAGPAEYLVYGLDDEMKRSFLVSTQAVTETSLTFDYTVDQGDVQRRQYFEVTALRDGVESPGCRTSVVVGSPYALPYYYDFDPKWITLGRDWVERLPDLTFWEGEHAWLDLMIGEQSDYCIYLNGRHNSFTTGKIEVKHHTYFNFYYGFYGFSFDTDEYPERVPTFEVFAIDPWGNETLLTRDDTGHGYSLEPVADNPWVRIKVESWQDRDGTLGYDEYSWYYELCFIEWIDVRHYAEEAVVRDVCLDGICYRLMPEEHEAQVIHPAEMAADMAYSGAVTVPARISVEGEEYVVSALSDQAFANAEQLTSLELPASIAHWRSTAFGGCHNLSSLSLHHQYLSPALKEALGEEAFTYLTNRCTLYVPAGTAEAYRAAPSFDRLHRICEYDFETGEVLRTDEREIVLRDVRLGSYRYDFNLTEQTAELQRNLVYRTDPLESFYGGDFVVPLTVDYCGLDCRVASLASDALQCCIYLTSLTLPSGVMFKAAEPFTDCEQLKAIYLNVLPPTFLHHDVGLPYALKESCVLYVPEGMGEVYRQCRVWNEFEQIIESASIVPDTDERLPIGQELTYRFDPSTLTAQVVSRELCYSGHIVIPDVVSHDGQEYRVTSVSDDAFQHCPELLSIKYGDNVTSCPGSLAYNHCPQLTEVSFGQGMGHVTDGLFYQAAESQDAEEGIWPEPLDVERFSLSAPSLTFDFEALLGAHISRLVLEESVREVSDFYFANVNCPTFECRNPMPPVVTQSTLFMDEDVAEGASLYVPAGSGPLYRSAHGWQEFGTIIEVDEQGNEDPGAGIRSICQERASGVWYTVDGKVVKNGPNEPSPSLNQTLPGVGRWVLRCGWAR